VDHPDPALRVTNLQKVYGEYAAVDGISFDVPRGSVVGLLGPNGAGKTTTMQMLTGITELTSGRVEYFGLDFVKHRQACLQRINFTSAYNNLQDKISVLENLKSFAYLYSVKNARKKVDELGEFFGIRDLFDQRFSTLSAGQSTRVNLVKALINDPELLLMDEPTASLDPDIRDRTMELIEDMRDKRQLSILYTSHNMDEVSRLCDEVIFLDHGHIVKQDTPENLAAELSQTCLSVRYSGGSREAVHEALSIIGLKPTHEGDATVTVEIDAAHMSTALLAIESIAQLKIEDVDIKRADLHDVFLDLARNSTEPREGESDVVVEN
jgi:ABC-2 type transport system ATP-binding protein